MVDYMVLLWGFRRFCITHFYRGYNATSTINCTIFANEENKIAFAYYRTV